MPYEFKLDHDKRVIFRRSWGVVDDQELLASHGELRKFPQQSSYRELHDFQDVTEYCVSLATVQWLALDPYNKPGCLSDNKVAAVVNGRVAYGLARMYDVFHRDIRQGFKLFTDYDEALAWLLDNDRVYDVRDETRQS